MKDVVIEIRRGMVTGVFCDASDTRFVVVDWDLSERDSSIATIENQESLASLPVATRVEFERLSSL